MSLFLSRRGLLLAAGATLLARKTFANFTPPPNDPNYPAQWHLNKISAATAWLISQGNSSTILAIIDTGVTLPVDTPLSSVAGYNEVNNNTTTTDQRSSSSGHGSMVADLALGATNDGAGSAALAPNLTLMPMVACGPTGSCSPTPVANAIDFVWQNSAHILSMSLSGVVQAGTPINDAWARAYSAGMCGAAASGDTGGNDPTSIPASMINITGVGATDINDVIASYSTTGCVKVVAPGGTAGAGNTMCLTDKSGVTGCGVTGASFATPLVASAKGLMRTANARYAALRNDEIDLLMYKYGCDIVGGIAGYPTIDNAYGYGRLNAAKCCIAARDYIRPFTVKSLSIGQ